MLDKKKTGMKISASNNELSYLKVTAVTALSLSQLQICDITFNLQWA